MDKIREEFESFMDEWQEMTAPSKLNIYNHGYMLGEGEKKMNEKKEVRVRIHKKDSIYNKKLGHILYSMSTGTFVVCIVIEGDPCILLKPEEVEPC